MGRGRRGDPAALALSVASDPNRAKLAEVLAKSIQIATELGLLGQIHRRVIARGSAYAARLKTGHLVHEASIRRSAVFISTTNSHGNAHREEGAGERGIYLLVDKSGSMYSVVDGVQKIVLAASWLRSSGVGM